MIPPKNRLYTCQQFNNLKRLYDIIICPHPESPDFINRSTFCRDENNRNAKRADIFHQFKSVHTRKHHIQKDQIIYVFSFFQNICCDSSVIQTFAYISGPGQAHAQQICDWFFIFYNQYSYHNKFLLSTFYIPRFLIHS